MLQAHHRADLDGWIGGGSYFHRLGRRLQPPLNLVKPAFGREDARAVEAGLLGEREHGTERLKEAVAAYRAALEEYTRERVPPDWAQKQNNLGGALIELGRRSGRKVDVENGRQAIVAAWDIYRDAGYTQYYDYFQSWIAEVDSTLAAME